MLKLASPPMLSEYTTLNVAEDWLSLLEDYFDNILDFRWDIAGRNSRVKYTKTYTKAQPRQDISM